MRQEGMLLTCDRCGVQTMLVKRREHEKDGGFTRWNTYDDEPEGWYIDTSYGRKSDICPCCSDKYKKLISDFYMSSKKED